MARKQLGAAPTLATHSQPYGSVLTSWASKTAPSGTPVGTTDTQTLSSKTITSRVVSPTIATTYTINADVTDLYVVNGQTSAATFNAPTGTLVDGQHLMVRIKSDATPRALTWNAIFISSGVATLLATTAANKTHNVG